MERERECVCERESERAREWRCVVRVMKPQLDVGRRTMTGARRGRLVRVRPRTDAREERERRAFIAV
jgi:hypothetical protein